jgi:hypothetical protein
MRYLLGEVFTPQTQSRRFADLPLTRLDLGLSTREARSVARPAIRRPVLRTTRGFVSHPVYEGVHARWASGLGAIRGGMAPDTGLSVVEARTNCAAAIAASPAPLGLGVDFISLGHRPGQPGIEINSAIQVC